MLNQSEVDKIIDNKTDEEKIELTNLPVSDDAFVLEKVEGNRAKKKEIRAYNFRSPNRFSKDQIRAIELLHEEFAERLTSTMPSLIRTDFRVKMVKVEQGRFDGFVKEAEASRLFHLVSLNPLPGSMILSISPNVSSVLLEFHLGSRQYSDFSEHTLTDIDQALIGNIVETILRDVKATWNNVVVFLEPSLDDTTENHRWVQMLMGNDPLLAISFEVFVQDIHGTMEIFVPYQMIKPIGNLLNPQYLISEPEQRSILSDSQDVLLKNIAQMKLPFRVILGGAQLALSDLSNLNVGDIIPLDSYAQDDFNVFVGDKRRFIARVGKIGQRLGAQILETIDIGLDGVE